MLSLVLRLLRVPLSVVRSARLKPVTASLKVMVTRDVLPMPRCSLVTTTVAVGRWVSIA